MNTSPEALPAWIRWQQRPFPDANLLALTGGRAAMIDSGFVGHAQQTADWAAEHVPGLQVVVNTHWHSDHVGANGLFQSQGVSVAAHAHDADALGRREAGCCCAQYLDQPVAPYTVDEPLEDGQVIELGAASWQVVGAPGHTPGHLAFWQPEERVLIVGDALSSYDVGWVDIAREGVGMVRTALHSLQRLADLSPAWLLPAHGPVPPDSGAAFAAAIRRATRLVEDPDGAVWYGVRRIFAYALMIRDGIATDEVEEYLVGREWLQDAAGLLHRSPEELAEELLTTMLGSRALRVDDGRVRAAAEYAPVPAATFEVPWPESW